LVKNDRRWFVPGVTEVKRDPKYWVDFNAWLVEGGLEIIHEWAHTYVAEHGTVGASDDAPVSDAKDKLILASRSEGQQLVFDLGEAAMRIEREVVLTDREVLEWLAIQRGMNVHDPKLEGLLTIRTQLRDAGMVEVLRHKLEGRRHVAFANQKANDRKEGEQTWQDLTAFRMAPGMVVATMKERRGKLAGTPRTSDVGSRKGCKVGGAIPGPGPFPHRDSDLLQS
jgi:hypothetical protein